MLSLTLPEPPVWQLVASGGHDALLELVGDRLADQLSPHAQCLMLSGAAHAIQRAPAADEAFETFWLSTARNPPATTTG